MGNPLCVKAFQLGFCFLCVGLAARYEELEVSYTACYLNVERQECRKRLS